MRTSLPREGLLQRLAGRAHVLICAPSGYGKTRLLQQYEQATPGSVYLSAGMDWTFQELLNAAAHAASMTAPARSLEDLASHGVRTLLIDDLHRLPDTTTTPLFTHLHNTTLKVIGAAYHSQYPLVHQMLAKDRILLLSSQDLAFTREEILSIEQGTLPAHTLGWPSVCALSGTAHFSLPNYLDDLISLLPVDAQGQLNALGEPAAVDALVLEWELSGQRRAVLNSGFPLIDWEGRFVMHPLMVNRLFNRPVARPLNTSSMYELYLRMAKSAPDATGTNLVLETYFRQFGETDASPRAGITMLRVLPYEQLSPGLRDRLADLLITTQNLDKAEKIIDYQRMNQQESSLTHVAQARLANYRSDIPALKAHSQRALETALTLEEKSRAMGMLSLYYTRTEGADYAMALKLAEDRYEVALQSGSLREELSSVWTYINAYQYAGRIDLGIAVARRGRQRGQGQQQLAATIVPILNEFADQLKATGEYAEALEVIQEALRMNEEEPTTSEPYTLFTRGLIYLEMRRDEDAHQAFLQSIKSFKETQIAAGLLMPYAFLAFLQWRQEWFEETEHTYEEMQRLLKQIGVRRDYVEWRAYVPLVNGVFYLGRRNPERALQEFREVQIQGHETYDSVLLTIMLICKVEMELRGTVPQEDMDTLVSILDFVPQNEHILSAYAPDFKVVLEHFVDQGFHADRFQKVLKQRNQTPIAKPSYHIHVTTMGDAPQIVINDTVLHTRNNWAIYTLAYLILQPTLPNGTRRYVTSSVLAADVYGGQKSQAQSSLAFLRSDLGSRDPELPEDLLSPRRDRHGYRINVASHLKVTIDVDDYLSRRFSPTNPDLQELWKLMREYKPFLRTRELTKDESFASRINDELLARFKAVVMHVQQTEVLLGRPQMALLAVLLYLRHDMDYEVIDAMNSLVQEHKIMHVEMERLFTSAQGDDEDEFQALVATFISVLNTAS